MPGTCPLADCNYEERPAVNASLILLYARNLSLGSPGSLSLDRCDIFTQACRDIDHRKFQI